MKRHYNELMNTNRDLINGYKIRSTNHEELLKNVKVLNQVVQRAGNLRGFSRYKYFFNLRCFIISIKIGGKHKTDVIASARQAIKSNNSISLVKIIKTGVP
jgi:Bardet-Biedl syndrome 2 protein